jgi:cobalt-precorrin 5A hydrolase
MTSQRKPYAVYVITKHGLEIARRLAEGMIGVDLYVSEKFMADAPKGAIPLKLPFGPLIGELFTEYDCHVFVISVGAVVRMIAPHIKSKKTDPAIVCIDDAAKFSICLLSGHVGRGNAFADRIAQVLGAIPVVTTASDVRGTLTVDILGRDLGWQLAHPDFNVTRGCAAVVNETAVCFVQETGEPSWWPLDKPLPPGVSYATDLARVDPRAYEMLLIASDRLLEKTHPEHAAQAVVYRPKSLVLGIGCDRGTPSDLVERGVLKLLEEAGLALASVKAIASIDLKQDETALLELSAKYNWPFVTYPAPLLDAVPGIQNPSETVRKYTGTRAVAEPAALLLAQAETLTIAKQKYSEPGADKSMTLAVARIPFSPRKQEPNVQPSIATAHAASHEVSHGA